MGASVDKIAYKDIDFHEKIGEGGFGTVNRVTFKKPFKRYREAAAKTVFKLPEEEVNILTELQHPNIVTLLGVCQTGAVNIILLEYARNGSLHDYLSDQSNSLPHELRDKWLKESALAIQYLHARNVLHRDIKASNCLLFENHCLKLCDFGLAREIDKSQTTSNRKGTYQYMAPEIHVGNERGRAVYSKPADIYSYGMLILELCTRKPPFDGMEWQAVVFQVGEGKQPDIPDDCPKKLADLMRGCWNSKPKERPSIGSIVEELFECQQVKTIHPMHEGEKFLVGKVACCPNGDLVAVELFPSYSILCVLDRDGKHKRFLLSNESTRDVTIAMQGKTIQVHTANAKILDENLENPLNFVTYLPNEDREAKVFLGCVAIDIDENILLFDKQNTRVTVHSCLNGKLLNSFKIKCNIYSHNSVSMAVNSKNDIIFHYRPPGSTYSKVVAVDYSGSEVFSFTPEIGEDLTDKWIWAKGIVCDRYDNIYIVIRSLGTDHTGHIHKYSSTGTFIRCIVKGLYWPQDLDMTPSGSLVVANWDSILVYSLK